jgi:hypothetical protein
MKLLSFLLVGIPLTVALQSQKPVIVTYPQDTPDDILGQAKQAIVEGVCSSSFVFNLILLMNCYLQSVMEQGGIITHEYRKL